MEKYGIPTDEQWAIMKRFIKSDKFNKEDFFVFETQAVGDRIVPNRYTRILPELLEVMKQDAQKGVSLMLNHNWSQSGVQSIPIGKVFDGRIGPGTQEGETTALYVSQYILRDDSKVDGYSKNDIIKLIESGIMSDTSIGWGTDTECYMCNICGNQYYSSKCNHWRGNKYIVDEESNEVKQCIVEVKAPKTLHAGNNVLMENSVVFDGAYPNAVIQSAIANETTETNGKVKILDEKENLGEGQRIYANSSTSHLDLYYIPLEKGGKAMEQEKLNSEVQEEEKVEEVETQEVEVAETEEVEATETQSAEIEETEEIQTQDTQSNTTDEVEESNEDVVETPSAETQSSISFENSELSEIFGEAEINKEMLLRLVKDGKMYRENVIEEALKSGVRSLGNAFNKESFEKTFNLMSTEDIKAMGSAWEKDVSDKFSSVRVSQDKKPEHSMGNSSEVDYSYLKTSTY